MSEAEGNFHRVVHYLAGVLWAKRAASQALAALQDALAATTRIDASDDRGR